jgi:hypothetical protein
MIAKNRLLVCFIVLMLLIGCSSFVKDAYRAGSISKGAYEMVMSSMGDLYRQGLIKETVKDQTIAIGKAYKEAHNSSIEALARYKEKGAPQDKQAYLTLAAEASTVLAKLLNFARPYLLDNGKEVP